MYFVGALQQRDQYSPDHRVFNNGLNHLNRVGILNQYPAQQNRVGIQQYPAQQVTQFGIPPHAARPFISPPQHVAPAQTFCGSPQFAQSAPPQPVCDSPAVVGNGRPINTINQHYNGNRHVMGNVLGNRQIPGIGNPQGSPIIPQYNHRAAQNFRAIAQNQYGSPLPRVQSAVPPHNIPLQVTNNLQGNHGYQVSHGYNLPSNHSYPGVAAVRNTIPPPQQQLYRTMIHQNLSSAHSPAPSRLPSPFIPPLLDDYYQEPPTRPLFYDPPSNLMKYAPTAKGLPFSSQDLRPEVLAVYIPGVGMWVKKHV
eukprot:sb/3467137/